MPRRTALVGAWVIALTACSGSATDATGATTTTPPPATTAVTTSGTVASDDGLASLDVPAEALPSGVAFEAIAVTATAEPAAGPAVDALLAAGYEPGPGYALEPSGAVFAKPLVLRFPAPEDGRTVTAFLVGDGTLEPLEPIAGDGVAFAVPHFSEVVTFFGPFFVFLIAPPDAEVGVPFTVRSRIYRKTDTLTTEGFQVGGAVIATAPVHPSTIQAPPPTATALPVFTSVYSFTCSDVGTSVIDHAIQASIPRSQLTPDAAALYPSTSDHLREMGLVSATVECIPAGTTIATAAASGIYTGNLQVTGIPGWPGGSYRDTFTLELRACGDAVLTQRSDQVTRGRFYTAIPYEVEPVDSSFYSAHTFGSGPDHGEAYELEVRLSGDTAEVSGTTAGGGHGFGKPLTELEAWVAALWAELDRTPPPELPIDAGWAGRVEGVLERIDDASPCE